MFLSWVLFIGFAHALSTEQILKTAWSDKTYRVYENLLDTDSKNPFRSVDGFYNVKNLEDQETEVGLKLNLKSYPEWKSGESRENQKKALKESALAWSLRDRYAVILSIYFGNKKLAILNDYSQAAERFLKAQSLSLKAGNTNSKNYLQAQSDLHQIQRDVAFLNEQIELSKNRIRQWLPEEKNIELANTEFIESTEISRRLKQQDSVHRSLSGKLARIELQQIEQEIQILRGRENQWVRSLEVSQVQKKEEKVYEMGVTIQLPPLGTDDWSRQRQNELILKSALKQRDLEQEGGRLQHLKAQILDAVSLYEKSRKDRSLIIKGRSADPMADMQTRLLGFKGDLEVLSQQQTVLTLYLDYLLESETLSMKPELNYLNAVEKVIQ